MLHKKPEKDIHLLNLMNQTKDLVLSENHIKNLKEFLSKWSWCIVFQAKNKKNNSIFWTVFKDQ